MLKKKSFKQNNDSYYQTIQLKYCLRKKFHLLMTLICGNIKNRQVLNTGSCYI